MIYTLLVAILFGTTVGTFWGLVMHSPAHLLLGAANALALGAFTVFSLGSIALLVVTVDILAAIALRFSASPWVWVTSISGSVAVWFAINPYAWSPSEAIPAKLSILATGTLFIAALFVVPIEHRSPNI